MHSPIASSTPTLRMMVVTMMMMLAASTRNAVVAFAPAVVVQRHTAPTKLYADKPELPSIAGDYDWDAKYSGDPDWLEGDAVPGKRVMNEIELAQQVTALGGLEERWRKDRIRNEYEDASSIGFVPTAEMFNGRAAMFFLVTGLLTEYWTGISIPGQVETMLRYTGIIGF